MNHKELNAELASLCRQLGVWVWINSGEVMQQGSGWVDAVALGKRGGLHIENKTEHGRRTMAQVRVARLLAGAGFEYRLYRPHDYGNGTVKRDLEAIA